MIFKGEEKIELINDFNRIAESIRLHNRIHQVKEPNSFFISEYLEMAADLFDKIADGDIQIVRHGYWIKTENENQYECSICGKSITTNTSLVDPADFENYCYNCGAKMDLKEGKDGKE